MNTKEKQPYYKMRLRKKIYLSIFFLCSFVIKIILKPCPYPDCDSTLASASFPHTLIRLALHRSKFVAFPT